MAVKTKLVQNGRWRTIEYLWNVSGTGFFLLPQGASIRVRYGGDSFWQGFTRQEQKLTGTHWMKLCVGGIGITARARIQIRVKEDTHVTYQMFPGAAAITAPESPLIM
jgi:hypothetical protein